MNSYYPIMLRLEGKKIVVVGGGNVAERKVNGLLDTGAIITVISPESTTGLQGLACEGKIIWEQRSFFEGDIRDAFMIYAATNDRQINQQVKVAAGDHQLVMIVDDPEESSFHLPSSFRRGRLNIAVSTGGASPTLARKIRERLEQQFDESYDDYLEFLFSTRQWILGEVDDALLRRKLLTAIVSEEFLESGNREADFQRIMSELK